MKNWVSGEEVSYTYDSLGRFSAASTTGPEWGLSFGYDGFGNKVSQTVTKGSGPSMSVAVDANNRVVGHTYDAAGNTTAVSGQFTSLTWDSMGRLQTAAVSGGGTDSYPYDASNTRVWRNNRLFLRGVGGEVLAVYDFNPGTRQFTFVRRYAWFAGKMVGKKEDRLGTVQTGSRFYPYGEEWPVTGQDDTKFATYWRDGSTNLDYAMNRYYQSTLGRFLSPDPGNAGAHFASGDSWSGYAYAEGDPINGLDPEGLDVQKLNLVPGPETCYSARFSRQISGDVNKWLNSDVGTMALQVWFEFSSATVNDFTRHMWMSLAQVYRNRWLLTPSEKRFQGFDPKADFKSIIYASAGHGWWNPNTAAGRQSHWNANGTLKSNHVNDLVRTLNSSPTSKECGALIESFKQSINVYEGRIADPTGSATFYVHYWYPSPPWGGSPPNLANPFGFRANPFITYITTFTPYTSIGGATYYVSAWFYRPADSWFYARN